LKIHFAHRSFVWASESRGKAHVHVVIIGFAAFDNTNKRIYDYEGETPTMFRATNINPYLVEGADIWVSKRREPLAKIEPMVYGSKPIDGGCLLLDDAERSDLLNACPEAASFIRPFIGSDEFINGISRWCIWLAGKTPGKWRNLAPICERIEKVRIFRSNSKKLATTEQASTPSVFGELRQPSVDYLAVPEVSSELRHYIPMGVVSACTRFHNMLGDDLTQPRSSECPCCALCLGLKYRHDLEGAEGKGEEGLEGFGVG
jgi:hypothetical protein